MVSSSGFASSSPQLKPDNLHSQSIYPAQAINAFAEFTGQANIYRAQTGRTQSGLIHSIPDIQWVAEPNRIYASADKPKNPHEVSTKLPAPLSDFQDLVDIVMAQPDVQLLKPAIKITSHGFEI